MRDRGAPGWAVGTGRGGDGRAEARPSPTWPGAHRPGAGPARAGARPGSVPASPDGRTARADRWIQAEPDSVAANIAEWTEANAQHTDGAAERQWARDEMAWGVFGIPESSVGCLGEVAGLDVVELGCGTAYISAWLARRGAQPVGVDPTPAQLRTARRMQAATGVEFPLVEAPGESVPLPGASFDLAISEYGASLWADPLKWVPEAARLVRPGGRLIFLTNSTLSTLCMPDAGPVTTTLQRPLFGLGRTRWPGERGIEYHLSHGRWIALLRSNGFEVEALHELQAPADAEAPVYYDDVTVEWARQWPAEEIWVARRA